MTKSSAEQHLDHTREDLAAAERRLSLVVRDEAKYAGSPQTYDAWKRDRDDAHSEVERHRLVVEQCVRDVEAEMIAAWQAKRRQQDRVNQTVAQRMRKEGPALLRSLLDLIADIVTAEAQTRSINATMPAGQNTLKGPDALARTRDMEPEKIVREVEVELWVDAETGAIVSDQRAVRASSSREGTFGIWRKPCVRRLFKEVTYLPEASVQRVSSLVQALRIPFFDGPGWAWNGDLLTDPAYASQRLEAAQASAPTQPDRQKQTRFVATGPWQPPPVLPSHGKAVGKRIGDEIVSTFEKD